MLDEFLKNFQSFLRIHFFNYIINAFSTRITKMLFTNNLY